MNFETNFELSRYNTLFICALYNSLTLICPAKVKFDHVDFKPQKLGKDKLEIVSKSVSHHVGLFHEF